MGQNILCKPRLTSNPACVACQTWYQPHSKILKLKNVSFQLPKEECISPRCFFNTSVPSLDLSAVNVPANLDFYPSCRQSKTIKRYATAPSPIQLHMMASARAMDETILKVTMISRPGFGCVIMLQSKPAPTQSIYPLTVSSLLEYNSPTFKGMISKFGRKQKKIPAL
jgi:hypothetical protein